MYRLTIPMGFILAVAGSDLIETNILGGVALTSLGIFILWLTGYIFKKYGV